MYHYSAIHDLSSMHYCVTANVIVLSLGKERKRVLPKAVHRSHPTLRLLDLSERLPATTGNTPLMGLPGVIGFARSHHFRRPPNCQLHSYEERQSSGIFIYPPPPFSSCTFVVPFCCVASSFTRFNQVYECVFGYIQWWIVVYE